MTWLISLITSFLARLFSDLRRDAALKDAGATEQALNSLESAENDEAKANRAADVIGPDQLHKPDRFARPE